jgi:hypothetical protein
MLTSVAIFLPILFMEGLEGQLFKDLAITMAVSHAASLLVAMTVIPAANRWALARRHSRRRASALVGGMANFAMRMTATPVARWSWIGGLLAAACCSLVHAPRWTICPSRRRSGLEQLPHAAGGNIETAKREFAPVVIERLKPYYEARSSRR